MSSIAFISDLHANLTAFEAVLADIRAAGVERTVCLGDVVDLGPSPRAVVDRLRELEVPGVRGNHDTLDEAPEIPHLAHMEAWTRAQLDEERRAYLEGLPLSLELELEGLRLLAVHGSPVSERESLLASTPDAELEAWSEGRALDVLVAGHTHVQLLRRLDRRLYVNVGSVGMPFERAFHGPPPRVLPWSEYAIVRAGVGGAVVELRRVPYDLDALAREIRTSGVPDPDAWLEQRGRS